METFKKNWITYLGITFLFLGFLYFLKMAIDEAWIPPLARVAVGLALGVTGMFIGYNMFKKHLSLTAQIIAGLGVGMTYATFGYASFSSEIAWSVHTLFLSLTTVTVAVSLIAAREDMRILMFISTLGGLLTPIVIQAQESQVWLLFSFVLLLNIGALYISAIKDWKELRVMSFVTTVIIYITYYLLFDPQQWQQPIFYLITLFVTYLVGLLISSIKDNRNFEGINLYLNLLNGINFVFWSILILDQFELAYAFPTIFTGFLFILTAATIYLLSNKSLLAPGIYGLLGIVVIAIATHDIGYHYTKAGMHYVITTCIWLFLIVLTFAAAQLSKTNALFKVSVFAWVIVLYYWFSKAWSVEWVSWFGVEYIPFINPGALAWMALAAAGFIGSRYLQAQSVAQKDAIEATVFKRLSTFTAILAHVVVGGLLTIQIQNAWEAYAIKITRLNLILSNVWLLYAMTLFLWGAYAKEKIYKTLGTVVILLTSCKIIFFDLHASKSFEKVIFLMLAGGLILLIAYINKRSSNTESKTNIPPPSQGEEIIDTNKA